MRFRYCCLFWLALLLASSAHAQVLAGWSMVETEHFRFHFPPQPRVDPASFAAQEERAYSELRSTFSGALPGKINFYVWNTREEAEHLLGRPVGFARPDLLLIHAAADQTPGHELTHVLVFHTVRPDQASRFLEEGTAAAFDLTARDRVARACMALQRNGVTRLSIAQLWLQGGRAPEDLLYPVAGAFVERLVTRGGRERFLQLLKRQTPDNARAIYGADFDRITAEFEGDLGRCVTSSGSTSPTGARQAAEPTIEALRARAQERMQRDRGSYSVEERRDIETLYQSANRDLRGASSKATLQRLVQKYPKSNRAGCAVLYLSQLSDGAEKEEYLKAAIASHSDAWFGDGVQVGALARHDLAIQYAGSSRIAEARKLAEEVRTLFPGAVDHRGGRLIDALQRLGLQ